MAYSIDEILEDENITIVSRIDEMGIYEFKVGELDPTITVEISRYPSTEMFRYSISHAIHTPTQAGPYRSSRTYGYDSAAYTLHMAISSITQYYNDAVSHQHSPSDSWLVNW